MKLNLNKPLCFFDLETTGLNVGKDKIVDICILKINPDQTKETFQTLINPEMPIPAEATSIHHITDDDVKNQPTFKDLAHKIKQFIGNGDLAGYNSNKFDVPLLVEEFLRCNVDFDIKNRRVIDVQNIFHKMEQRTLNAASQFYLGKEIENAHSALADTEATFEIFKAQIQKYEGIPFKDKQGRISQPIVNDMEALSNFSNMFNAVDFSGHIVLNEKKEAVLNFGKHKGKPVKDVFMKEPNYYSWMMNSDFPLYTKKVITELYMQTKTTLF